MYAQTVASRSHRAAYKPGGSTKKTAVDESRLGNSAASGSMRDVAVLSSSQMKSIQGLVGNTLEQSVLSTVELQRMKDTASGEIERREAAAKQASQAAKAEQLEKAQARKARMRELEVQRKKEVPLSDIEQAKAEEKAAKLTSAEMQLSEELDDVKKMNQMMLYAKVVTIRDAQVNEKKVIEKERQEEERRLDTIMEIERLKALEMYAQREAKQKQDRRLGASVITDQIKERERERVRQLEMQDQERDAMVRQVGVMKENEIKAAQAKIEMGKKMVAEVAMSNAQQIELKKTAGDYEKEDDRRIAAYCRDRERREMEYNQQQEAIKAAKERETLRLRAMQEKMADKQAELDGLRSKRAIEEAERQWRRKEAAAAERQLSINITLNEAREAQKLEKERRLMEQAIQEKEEFGRILRVQKETTEAEEAIKYKRLDTLKMHQEELTTQILMNGEVRKKNRMDFLNEGSRARQQMEADRLKLEAIKAHKIATLHAQGVPDKYTVDLANKKFS